MPDNYYSEVNENGVVTPLRDLAAFPRSEQAVLGAKNINLTKYESGTWSGVIWTVNSDNSLTGNGTVDNAQSDNGANTALGFVAPFTGMVKCLGGIDVNLCVFPYDWTISARPFTDATKTQRVSDQYGEPMSFYMEKGHNYTLVVRAKQGRELNNITVFPQILLETDSDLTYSAPAMTNRELTENKIGWKDLPTLTSSNDLDDYKKAGVYYIDSSAPIHAPEGKTYSILEIIEGSAGSGVIMQRYTRPYSGLVYIRVFNGSWQSWYKFEGTAVS